MTKRKQTRKRERWRTIIIDGKETTFEVSDLGNLRHTRTHHPRPIYRNVKTGRPFSTFYVGPRKYKTRYVHLLVRKRS